MSCPWSPATGYSCTSRFSWAWLEARSLSEWDLFPAGFHRKHREAHSAFTALATSVNRLPYSSDQSWLWRWAGRTFFEAWRPCWAYGELDSFYSAANPPRQGRPSALLRWSQ